MDKQAYKISSSVSFNRNPQTDDIKFNAIFQLSEPYQKYDQVALVHRGGSVHRMLVVGCIDKQPKEVLTDLSEGYYCQHGKAMSDLGYTLVYPKTEQLAEISSFWIGIHGWSTEREVRLITENGSTWAYLEIAEKGHCGTCRDRICEAEHYLGLFTSDHMGTYLFDRHPGDGPTVWMGFRLADDVLTISQLTTVLEKAFQIKVRHHNNISQK
ncbi:MAG: hypothetical protein WCO55_01335 [Candidatus Falkowbacteria bacterium]